MTAILITGLAIILAGTAVLLLALKRGTEADESRTAAWQDDGWQHDAETLARLAQERARTEMRERIAQLMREAKR